MKFSTVFLAACVAIFHSAIFFTTSSSSFLPALPMVWTETGSQLKSGEATALLLFKIEKPCEQFYDANIVPNTLEFFKDWCDKQFDESIIQPLEELCRPAFANANAGGGSLSRKKRFLGAIISGISAIPMVVGAVQSVVGLFSKRRCPNRQDELLNSIVGRISAISNEISQLNSRTTQLEANQRALEKALQQLSEEVKKLDERLSKAEIEIDQLKEWKDELTKTLGPTVTLVAKLTAYFTLAKDQLIEVRREWNDKRLSLKIFDVFMMGHDLPFVNLFKGSYPIQCHMDTRDRVVTFQLLKNVTDSGDLGVKVLRASPFTFYRQLPDSELGFKLSYVGPREVAYDTLSDCLVPYSSDASSDLTQFPAAMDCEAMNESSVYKYWRKSCEPLYFLDSSLIQIRVVDDHWYVYCEGFEVKLYKSLRQCPPYVFSIHSNETLDIMTGRTITKTLKPINFKASQSYYSNKVTNQLMPNIATLDMDNWPLGSDCPTSFLPGGNRLRGNLEGGRGGDGYLGGESRVGFAEIGLVVIFVLFILLVIGVFCYVRRSNPKIRGNNYEYSTRSSSAAAAANRDHNGGQNQGLLALPAPGGNSYEMDSRK